MTRDPYVPEIPDVPYVPGVPYVPCDPGNYGGPGNCDGPDPYDVMKIYCFPGILTLSEVVKVVVFSALLDILTKLAGEAGD